MALVYVDDDDTICWLMEREWKARYPAFPIFIVNTPAEALSRVQEIGDTLKAVIVDWRLTAITAEDLLQQLRSLRPDLCLIAISAVSDARQLSLARRAGADRFLEKDLSMQVFVREVAATIDQVFQERPAPTQKTGKR
jgi:DNA-binding NtrC family response regulator